MKEHICIALNDDLLRIVQVKGSGVSARVTNIVSRTTAGVSEAEMPKFIQSALAGFNVKSSVVSYVASPNLITSKNIEIPSKNTEEIKSIVNLQASRHTPYTRDEIQVGYINLGANKNNYTKVLLVIANKHILKGQLLLLESAGVKVKNVLFPAEGIASFYDSLLKLKKNTPPQGIIDIGKSSTDFVVVYRGKVITARNIPVGREQLVKDGDIARDQLVNELKSTVESFQAEEIGQGPSEYILTGNDDLNKFVEQNIKDQLGWAVKIVPYLKGVKASKKLATKIGQEIGQSSYLDLIASAASFSKTSMNLIPEEVQLQKFIKDQTREVFKALVLVIVILFLVAGTFSLRWYFHNSALEKLKSDYQSTHEEVALLRAKSDRIRNLREYLASRMISLDIIYELYQRIPREVYLSNIQMVDEKTVLIQGISETASLVYKLRSTLKESELFESVKVKSQSARKDRGKDVAGFEIELILEE